MNYKSYNTKEELLKMGYHMDAKETYFFKTVDDRYDVVVIRVVDRVIEYSNSSFAMEELKKLKTEQPKI